MQQPETLILLNLLLIIGLGSLDVVGLRAIFANLILNVIA